MDFKNQSIQKSLQNAVIQSWKNLGEQAIFTDRFAKACVEFDLNRLLPEGVEPIPEWTEASYSTPNKKLFRWLGLKDADTCKFNVEVVSITYKALLRAMPKHIRIEFINSQHEGLDVQCVDSVKAEQDRCLDAAKNKAIKEIGEALSAIAQADPEDKESIKKLSKEALEAKQSLRELLEAAD